MCKAWYSERALQKVPSRKCFCSEPASLAPKCLPCRRPPFLFSPATQSFLPQTVFATDSLLTFLLSMPRNAVPTGSLNNTAAGMTTLLCLSHVIWGTRHDPRDQVPAQVPGQVHSDPRGALPHCFEPIRL